MIANNMIWFKQQFCMPMSFFLRHTGKSLGVIGRQIVRHLLSLPAKKELSFTSGTATKVTYNNSLRELILLEEFKNCLPEHIVVY